MTMNTNALIAASKFFSLAETAARNGGFWVSAAGGTAMVIAEEIARATGASYEEARHALDLMGRETWGDDWYQAMAEMQPWPTTTIPCDPDTGEWWSRWSARTIARAACRQVRVA